MKRHSHKNKFDWDDVGLAGGLIFVGAVCYFAYQGNKMDKEAQKVSFTANALILNKNTETTSVFIPTGKGGGYVQNDYKYFVETDKGEFVSPDIEVYSQFDVGKKYEFSYYKFNGEDKIYEHEQPYEILAKPSISATNKPKIIKPQPN